MVPRDMPPGPELPAVEPGETRDSPSVAAGSASDADSPSRRRFLKASAAAAGGSLLGGCLSEDSTPTTFRLGGAAFDTFDHTVVVMFENNPSVVLLPPTLPKESFAAEKRIPNTFGSWNSPGEPSGEK